MEKSFSLLFKVKILTFFLMFTLGLSADDDSLIIGFGSCVEQPRAQPIWDKIAVHNPDLFILLGDNIYNDSEDPIRFKNAYNTLATNPNFSKFRKATPIIATWDDHDYGVLDGGGDFAGKYTARNAYIKFFDYPEINQIKELDRGIHHTRWLEFNGKKIQIILLDSRWYRDPLVKSYLSYEQRIALNLGPIQPTVDESTTLLGEPQWLWLEEELKKPADLKLLISSIQVLVEFSGWESWANFPHERNRLLDLVHQYGDDKLLILSGDIHKAEISQLEYKGKKILEVTSSPLASATYPASNNRHKIGETVEALNYGIVKITDDGELSVEASIYNFEGIKKLTTHLKEK